MRMRALRCAAAFHRRQRRENLLYTFQRRGGGFESGEQRQLTVTDAAFYPTRQQLPQIGARDPALLAALAPEDCQPSPELLSVFVIVPKLLIERDVPFGDESGGAARKTPSGIGIEELRALGLDDGLPERPLLRGREQGRRIYRVARLLPTRRQPRIEAV